MVLLIPFRKVLLSIAGLSCLVALALSPLEAQDATKPAPPAKLDDATRKSIDRALAFIAAKQTLMVPGPMVGINIALPSLRLPCWLS